MFTQSAVAVCERIRAQSFFRDHREIQFAVVCDVTRYYDNDDNDDYDNEDHDDDDDSAAIGKYSFAFFMMSQGACLLYFLVSQGTMYMCFVFHSLYFAMSPGV